MLLLLIEMINTKKDMKRIGVTGILLLMTACLQAQTVVSVRYAGTNGVDNDVLIYEDTLQLIDNQFYADYVYLSGYTYKGAYTMLPELKIVNNTGSVIYQGSDIGIKGQLNNIAMDYWDEEYWVIDTDWAVGDTITCLLGAYSEPVIRVTDLRQGMNSICFMVSSLNNASVEDAGSCTKIAVESSSVFQGRQEIAFAVYPVPANDILYICNADNTLAEIISLNGQKIKSRQVSGDKCQMDVSDLPTGVYIVRICSKQGVSIRKINIVR